MKEVRYKRDLCNSKEDITKMAEFISGCQRFEEGEETESKGNMKEHFREMKVFHIMIT